MSFLPWVALAGPKIINLNNYPLVMGDHTLSTLMFVLLMQGGGYQEVKIDPNTFTLWKDLVTSDPVILNIDVPAMDVSFQVHNPVILKYMSSGDVGELCFSFSFFNDTLVHDVNVIMVNYFGDEFGLYVIAESTPAREPIE